MLAALIIYLRNRDHHYDYYSGSIFDVFEPYDPSKDDVRQIKREIKSTIWYIFYFSFILLAAIGMFSAMVYTMVCVHFGSDYNGLMDYVMISMFGIADLAFFVFWVALIARYIKIKKH